MATTLFTTATQIFGDTFENLTNGDPNFELDMTEEQREQFKVDCRDHFISEADQMLAPYGAEMLGNGDIIGKWGESAAFSEALLDGDLKQELGMIDLDPVITKWMDRLDG